MKWTLNHRYIDKEPLKYGDCRIKRRFCLFPRTQYNIESNSTTYYWLQNVFIAYEWTEGTNVEWDPSGIPVCEPDYWRRIGIATTYNNAVKGIWN